MVTQQAVSQKILNTAKDHPKNPTSQEKKLWHHLRANRLAGFHFRRQQVIDRFIVDFYNHAARLVIEIDGSVHDDPTQANYDHVRQKFLEEKGLKVIRFRNQDMDLHLEEVLQKITIECEGNISERPS